MGEIIIDQTRIQTRATRIQTRATPISSQVLLLLSYLALVWPSHSSPSPSIHICPRSLEDHRKFFSRQVLTCHLQEFSCNMIGKIMTAYSRSENCISTGNSGWPWSYSSAAKNRPDQDWNPDPLNIWSSVLHVSTTQASVPYVNFV